MPISDWREAAARCIPSRYWEAAARFAQFLESCDGKIAIEMLAITGRRVVIAKRMLKMDGEWGREYFVLSGAGLCRNHYSGHNDSCMTPVPASPLELVAAMYREGNAYECPDPDKLEQSVRAELDRLAGEIWARQRIKTQS